ncbi:MAG: alpha/beta hydrolase [Leptospiraceae bacterium]|nr:alpha/beta hydrolase [Leptospiraceae bacterium]
MESGFKELSNGKTYYSLEGEGPTVVLIHGIGSPSHSYDFLTKELVGKGFSVLRYDLYGRGRSAKPLVENNPEFFLNQARELLDSLNLKSIHAIVSTSLGSIVTSYLINRSNLFTNKLVFIAPAGYPQKLPFLAEVLKIQFIGNFLIHLFGKKVLTDGVEYNFHNLEFVNDLREKNLEQMNEPEFFDSFLSAMNFMPLQTNSEEFKKLGDRKIPSLLIWGKEDQVIPYENHKLFLKDVDAKFHFIPNCGHMPQIERAPETAKVIIEFLMN